MEQHQNHKNAQMAPISYTFWDRYTKGDMPPILLSLLLFIPQVVYITGVKKKLKTNITGGSLSMGPKESIMRTLLLSKMTNLTCHKLIKLQEYGDN